MSALYPPIYKGATAGLPGIFGLVPAAAAGDQAKFFGADGTWKRPNIPRVTAITTSATPTVNTDTCDSVTITALATAITSATTNLSGTPSNFDRLLWRIKDDGTARAITWGASFASRGATLPSTTTSGKITYAGFIWNSVAATWDCVAASTEA